MLPSSAGPLSRKFHNKINAQKNKFPLPHNPPPSDHQWVLSRFLSSVPRLALIASFEIP